jgi:hypothetical protein
MPSSLRRSSIPEVFWCAGVFAVSLIQPCHKQAETQGLLIHFVPYLCNGRGVPVVWANDNLVITKRSLMQTAGASYPFCSPSIYLGSPMVCDVIWFLSNELCVFYPWALAFFLSHIYHLKPVFVDFIFWTVWRRNTQCDIKKISYEWYHIDIEENMWWILLLYFHVKYSNLIGRETFEKKYFPLRTESHTL